MKNVNTKKFKNYLNEANDASDGSVESIISWLKSVNETYEDEKDDYNILYNRTTKCYDISSHMVTLQTDDIELPYPFNECDSFSIVDKKLKTLKNFPKNTMHNTILDIYFVECHMLEFKDSRYTLPKSDMNFFNMDKIHINDLFDFSLFSNINSITFDNCGNPKLNDFSTYKTLIPTVYLHTDKNVINVTNLLTNKECVVEFIKIENENYDKKLNVIINDYINRNNKEQYAMDMTMELIDAGFEDVV